MLDINTKATRVGVDIPSFAVFECLRYICNLNPEHALVTLSTCGPAIANIILVYLRYLVI